MKKVLLVWPPSPYLLEEYIMPPLGILFLGGYLKRHGHEVRVADLSGVADWRALINEQVRSFSPDIIGFSSTTPQYPHCLRIRDHLRAQGIRAKMVIGGVHPTSDPVRVAGDGWDSLVIDEGENAMLKICQDDPLKKQYREPLIEDLDTIGHPDRDLIDIRRYHYEMGGVRTSTTFSQKGCCFSCCYCLPPTQEIWTANGLKPISEVELGELVLTHKGRFRRIVNKVVHHFSGNLVKIRTKCGTDEEFATLSTPDHPYLTRHLTYGEHGMLLQTVQWLASEQIKEYNVNRASDFIMFPRIREEIKPVTVSTRVSYFGKEIIHSYPVNSDLLTIFGWYLAEGGLAHSQSRGIHSVVFSFGSTLLEYSYVGELMRALTNLGEKSTLYKVPTGLRVVVHSVRLARFIHEQLGNHADAKHIPLWVKLLPKKDLECLFSAYMRGDGTRKQRRHNNGTISLIGRTVCKRLALDIRDVALKIGYVASLGVQEIEPIILGRRVNCKKQYYITCTESPDSTIRNDSDYVYLAVKSKELMPYDGDVYDIEVEEDHSFCTAYHCVKNCEGPLMGRFKIRYHSPEWFLEECHIALSYGFRGLFDFADEMNLNIPRLHEICRLVKPLDMRFRGFFVASRSSIETLQTMKDAGFWELGVGMESGSPEILRNIHKPQTLEIMKTFAKQAHQVGIRYKAFLIVGLPGETWDTIRQTEKMLEECRPSDLDVSILQIYPGSPISQHEEQYRNLGLKWDIDYKSLENLWFKSDPNKYQELIRVETAGMTKADLIAARMYLERKFKSPEWIEKHAPKTPWERKDADLPYVREWARSLQH